MGIRYRQAISSSNIVRRYRPHIGELLQKQLCPLKRLVERMDRLMTATGFPVFADRFNEVFNHPSPFASAFPTPSRPSLPIFLYRWRREIHAVVIEDLKMLFANR